MKHLFLLGLVLLMGCNKSDLKRSEEAHPEICLESSITNGKIFYDNNQLMLKGGDSLNWSFDISNWSMGYCKLSNGIGRETFPALLESKYISIASEIGFFLTKLEANFVKSWPVKWNFHSLSSF